MDFAFIFSSPEAYYGFAMGAALTLVAFIVSALFFLLTYLLVSFFKFRLSRLRRDK